MLSKSSNYSERYAGKTVVIASFAAPTSYTKKATIRTEVCANKPAVKLTGIAEIDEVYLIAGHKGFPSRGEYARDEDGDGFHEVYVNTMEGFWSLLRSWLRPHRGISQELCRYIWDFSSLFIMLENVVKLYWNLCFHFCCNQNYALKTGYEPKIFVYCSLIRKSYVAKICLYQQKQSAINLLPAG